MKRLLAGRGAGPGTFRWTALAVCALAFVYVALPVVHYRGIVIHHTASSRDNRDSVRRLHRPTYGLDAAYHMILSNGSTEVPRGFLETTWWYRLGLPSFASKSRRCNLTTLQICVVGNYETQEIVEPTAIDLARAVTALQVRYSIPDSQVRLHRQCNQTLCPGKSITLDRLARWKELAASRADREVESQQISAIRAPFLFGSQLSKAGAAVAFLVVLGLFSVRSYSRSSRRFTGGRKTADHQRRESANP